MIDKRLEEITAAPIEVDRLGSISAAISCQVYPPREFGGGARAPIPNSGW